MDLEKVKKVFDRYTEAYDKSMKEIGLKYIHSYKVMDLMGRLATELQLSEEEIEVAKVIGLLHDIGRFEQFRKYHTLNDSKSSDHADESCIYLFEEGHIRDFIETNQYDSIIHDAIKNHNKKEIDPNMTDPKSLLFTKMIRDMDKVDIYRVYATYYEYEFQANEVTLAVLKNFQEEKLIDLSLRKTKSDAVLVIVAFLFDINFEESFDILASSDNFELFLSTVHIGSDSEKLWNKVKEIAIHKINKGVSEKC